MQEKNFSLDDRFEYQLQGMTKALDFIEEEPTVDAVEVVRCKDCAYGSQDPLIDIGINCGFMGVSMLHNSCCSWGMKRDGGTE